MINQCVGTVIGSITGMVFGIFLRKIVPVEWAAQVLAVVGIFLVAVLVFIELHRLPAQKHMGFFGGGVQVCGLCFTFVTLLAMHEETESDMNMGFGRAAAIVTGSLLMAANALEERAFPSFHMPGR